MGHPVGACSAAPLSTYSLVGPYQAGPHLHFAICQTPLSDVVHHRNGYECCSCPSMCLAAKLCNRAAIVSISYEIWFLQTSLVYLAIFWYLGRFLETVVDITEVDMNDAPAPGFRLLLNITKMLLHCNVQFQS